MGSLLDLDDLTEGHPGARAELEALRNDATRYRFCVSESGYGTMPLHAIYESWNGEGGCAGFTDAVDASMGALAPSELMHQMINVRKPVFEFSANSTAMADESGVAVWRYTDERRSGDVEVVVRQEFPSFRAAFAMDGLIAVAFAAGVAHGHAHCERTVLNALKSA